MGAVERPLDGGDEQVRATDNGPREPAEVEILGELFGEADPFGVFAPGADRDCGGNCGCEGGSDGR